MKQIRWISLLFCLTMLFGMFAGCGSTVASAPAAETPSTAVQENSAPAQEGPASTMNDLKELPSAAEPSEAGPAEDEISYEKVEVTMPFADGETVSMFLLLPPFVSAMLGSPHDLSVLGELERRSGLTFDITEGSYLDASTDVNLMIASGTYPDIINHADIYSNGIEAAVDHEVVIDLKDYIMNDMPNLLATFMNYGSGDVLKEITTSEGYMPYIPQIHKNPIIDSFAIGIRRDLMNELGVSDPKTFDEFHDLLVQVKNTYGLQYGMQKEGYDHALLMGYNLMAGGSEGSGVAAFRVIDGQVDPCAAADEMYDYVSMIRDWYSEGLIFTDFISYENYAQNNMISTGGLFGGGGVLSSTIAEADAAGAGCQIEAIPYVTPTGSETINIHGTGSIVRCPAWSISTQCDPDTIPLILQLVEYMFSDEGILLYNYGIENQAFEYGADGEPEWTDLILNYEGGTTTAAFLYATANPTEYIPGVYDDDKFNYSYTQTMLDCEDILNHSSTGAWDYPQAAQNLISSEDSLRAANLSTDLGTYITETVLSWIHGEKPLDEAAWQAYVDTCYSMGLQEIVDIYQAAYEDYMAE